MGRILIVIGMSHCIRTSALHGLRISRDEPVLVPGPDTTSNCLPSSLLWQSLPGGPTDSTIVVRCAHFTALCCPQTEGRDSEDGAGESCGGKCADSKPPLTLSFQPPDGKQHDIEAGNPLSVDGVNPMVSDSSAPVGDAAEQPAGGMAGRLARLKQMLWRKT